MRNPTQAKKFCCLKTKRRKEFRKVPILTDWCNFQNMPNKMYRSQTVTHCIFKLTSNINKSPFKKPLNMTILIHFRIGCDHLSSNSYCVVQSVSKVPGGWKEGDSTSFPTLSPGLPVWSHRLSLVPRTTSAGLWKCRCLVGSKAEASSGFSGLNMSVREWLGGPWRPGVQSLSQPAPRNTKSVGYSTPFHPSCPSYASRRFLLL